MVVKFEVYKGERNWCARALGESIFTQGKTLDELMSNVDEATTLHFEGRLAKTEKVTVLLIMERTLCNAKASTS